jgi:hypothetical protein
MVVHVFTLNPLLPSNGPGVARRPDRQVISDGIRETQVYPIAAGHSFSGRRINPFYEMELEVIKKRGKSKKKGREQQNG